MLKLEDLKNGDEFEFIDDSCKTGFIKGHRANLDIVDICMSKCGTFEVSRASSGFVNIEPNNKSGYGVSRIDRSEWQFFKLVAKGAPTRHKNAGMIIAKANDINLVALIKCKNRPWESISHCSFDSEHLEYYLCHQKHVEACLHRLNGGQVTINGMSDLLMGNYELPWVHGSDFMDSNLEIKIKIVPEKEKRWIVYNPKTREVFDCERTNTPAKGFQKKEIEVEV